MAKFLEIETCGNYARRLLINHDYITMVESLGGCVDIHVADVTFFRTETYDFDGIKAELGIED